MNEDILTEVSRVQEIMYGDLNEGTREALASIRSVASKFGDEFKTIRNKITRLRNADKVRARSVIDSADELTAQINAKITNIESELLILNNNKKNYSKAAYDAAVKKANDEITRLNGEKDELAKILTNFKNEIKNKKTTTSAGGTTAGGTTAGGTIATGAINASLKAALAKLTSQNVYKFVAKLIAGGALLGLGAWIISAIRKRNNDLGCIVDAAQKRAKDITVGAQSKEYEGLTTYYIKNPTHIGLKQKFPKGIALQCDLNNRKVFEIGGSKPVAKWYADNNCVLYVRLGGTDFPIFSENEKSEKPPKPDDGGGKKKTGFKYKLCRGTYQQGCKADKIYDLQRCLGITQDGMWGKNTQTAVINAKLGSQLNDRQIDQFCLAAQGQPTPQPIPQPQPPVQQGAELSQGEEY